MRWVLPDLEALSRAAAALFVRRARHAIARRGIFRVVLAGGQTPRGTYERLARSPCREAVDWARVHVFWGDERCVPLDDPRSNFRTAREALLDHVPIPPEHLHPIRCEEGPTAAAARYEAELRRFFGDGPPVFDLVFLGLGADGHTASLFPFARALAEGERWVVEVTEADPPRVTMSATLLGGAERVVFLVAGASKAAALRATWAGPFDPWRWPAQRIRPGPGRLLWLVDAAAASFPDPVPGGDRT